MTQVANHQSLLILKAVYRSCRFAHVDFAAAELVGFLAAVKNETQNLLGLANRTFMFVDRVKIEVSAGNGGNGCMSFRREKYVAKGGPDGGDGGDGGSVFIVAKSGVNSLVNLAQRKQWKAEKGRPGSGSNRHGRKGLDQIIEVPPGTIVIDAEKQFIIKDLTSHGSEIVAARGGKGGKGNPHFKSASNQAPRDWTAGSLGERRTLILELKVIADVGLIGKPNAGKSTLLSRISRATPEIADYPFTTKYPNLGQVPVDLDHSFVMADIPGLIEGASTGAGLGHEFLKHIERAGILVHLVEPQPIDQTDPIENYHMIRNELLQFNPRLADRSEIVVVTKAELPDAEQVRDALSITIDRPVRLISAVTGSGLKELVLSIAAKLEEQTIYK